MNTFYQIYIAVLFLGIGYAVRLLLLTFKNKKQDEKNTRS